MTSITVDFSTCWTCEKRSFKSKSEAKKAMKQSRKGTRNLYSCPETGEWHITSQTRRVSKAWNQYRQNR